MKAEDEPLCFLISSFDFLRVLDLPGKSLIIEQKSSHINRQTNNIFVF